MTEVMAMSRLALALGAVLSLGGCASRCRCPCPPECAATAPVEVATASVPKDARAEIEAGLAKSKKDTSFLPMLPQARAHSAMPSQFKGRPMPTLMLVGALQPKTMESLMAFAKAMRTEGDLDSKLLNDVFWVVSHVNECLY